MQIIIEIIVGAAEYQEHGKDYPFPDLTGTICPQCKNSLLLRHGYYKRWLILPNFEGQIHIRRYRCPSCGRTISLLPSFAHPGRTYGIAFIIGVLSQYYVETQGVMDAIRRFAMESVATCSRQLLRHFRNRFEENLSALISEMIVVLSLRAPPVNEKSIRKRGKQFLECVQRLRPEDVSKKLFEHSQTTYLSPLPSH